MTIDELNGYFYTKNPQQNIEYEVVNQYFNLIILRGLPPYSHVFKSIIVVGESQIKEVKIGSVQALMLEFELCRPLQTITIVRKWRDMLGHNEQYFTLDLLTGDLTDIHGSKAYDIEWWDDFHTLVNFESDIIK